MLPRRGYKCVWFGEVVGRYTTPTYRIRQAVFGNGFDAPVGVAQERRGNLTRRDLAMWTFSIFTAWLLFESGRHTKNVAELSGGEAGLYRLMPGIFVGLCAGFFLDNGLVVALVTIAANAAFYYYTLRLSICLWSKFSSQNREK